MNNYDREALHAIRRYYEKYNKHPLRIEATAAYREKMSCTHFECAELPEPVDDLHKAQSV